MRKALFALTAGLYGLLGVCMVTHAQTTLDQGKALAGGAVPGDGPGFPITISQPGSYKLTSNLTVPADTTAIDITVAGVTLDLNGFAIMGPSKCAVAGPGATTCNVPLNKFGIELIRAVDGVTLVNGTVQGSAGVGIKLSGGGHLLQHLLVKDTAGVAVLRAGSNPAPSVLRSVRLVAGLFDAVQGQYLQIEDSLITGFNFNGVTTGNLYNNTITASLMSNIGNSALGSVVTRNSTYFDLANNVGLGKSLGGNSLNGMPF